MRLLGAGLLCGLQFSVLQAAALTPATAVDARRAHAWEVVVRLSREFDPLRSPTLVEWYRREEIFLRSSVFGAMDSSSTVQSSEPEVIIETLYNNVARAHILDLRLNQLPELNRLLIEGAADPAVSENRVIEPFPAGATVLLAAWWPIARDGDTALPVWDPENEQPRAGGNNYATWKRIVAITPELIASRTTRRSMNSFGQNHKDVHSVPLKDFLHLQLDGANAERLMRNPQARKAAFIAIGRLLKAGDSLALVALHVASRDSSEWHWITLWWHDRAERGAYARLRPPIVQPWQNYLMDVADPSNDSLSASTFNPWFEARFPDKGHGGGMASNCIACHQRASYPPVNFLPIRTGPPNLESDPAYAPGRLRTDSLWSIARQGLVR